MFVVAVAGVGCGGSQKPAAAPAANPCVAMAAHAGAIGPAEMPAEQRALLERVALESCEGDAWAPAVIECMTGATADTAEACMKQLTEAQQQSMTKRLAEELDKGMSHPTDEEAPAPGATDPCAGGE